MPKEIRIYDVIDDFWLCTNGSEDIVFFDEE